MKRSNLQIAFYLLAVFLSGVVVGGFAHRLYMVKSVTAEPRRRTPEEYRQKYVDDMRARLKLSDAQALQLNQILDKTGDRFRAFRESHKPEVDAIHAEQVQEIRSMLSSEQQVEYDAYRAEREKRRRENERDGKDKPPKP